MCIRSRLSLFTICLWIASAAPVPAQVQPVPADYFAVPDFQTLPPNIEVLSEKVADGVKVTELYFAGAPFNGQPTRIYAYYCRPEKTGVYPAVVELHGAGLDVLSPASAIRYAQNGFCCIALDWAGPCADRKQPRKPPYSEFNSPGNLAYPLPDADKAKAPPHGWRLYGPDVDGVRNGVLFIRRAVMFLQSRPEADPDKLCISGMSAGAHLTLLALGVEHSFKAAAVKYGRAYIRDLCFGGYFGPITMCSEEQQNAWLAALDPKHHINDFNAKVLLLSGTDDIFFWMPGVLHTYRAIPTDKRLLMLPNDNHTQVGNVPVPLAWFRSILKIAPPWPTVDAPAATSQGDTLQLSVKVAASTSITNVAFWIKRSPRANFHWSGKEVAKIPGQNPPPQPVPWVSIPAHSVGNLYVASIPAAQPDEQIVVYAMVEDAGGIKVSSDTLEYPSYPEWRQIHKNR
ncbi:MAG: alpha/beta hydrolase family protein [Phycisphaerales bacterium]